MRIDYDEIAAGYDSFRRGRGPYFDTLVGLARGAGGQRVLELGAGTGNNTTAMMEAYPCTMTALEPSLGMTARACVKGVGARWVRGSAPAIPFAARSFDFVFGTYMLHHLRDLDALFRECRRALDGGCAAFVTVPQAFIAAHPMCAYFPSFSAIDLARFQPVEAVEAAMRAAGLARVTSKNHVDEPRPIDAAYVERVAGKFISTYDLLPGAEFREGVRRLRAEVRAKGRLDRPIAREAVVVWGYRD